MDADDRLGELLEQLNQSGLRPDAIVFTGDLADKGEPAAYRKPEAWSSRSRRSWAPSSSG